MLACQVVDAAREGQLAVVLSDFEAAPPPIQMAYPSMRLLSAIVRAFVDLIVDSCDWRFVEM